MKIVLLSVRVHEAHDKKPVFVGVVYKAYTGPTLHKYASLFAFHNVHILWSIGDGLNLFLLCFFYRFECNSMHQEFGTVYQFVFHHVLPT
jgi:hypothetical protein